MAPKRTMMASNQQLIDLAKLRPHLTPEFKLVGQQVVKPVERFQQNSIKRCPFSTASAFVSGVCANEDFKT
ncbi:unnamed protein product [Danaus chrysippus]|uniref:(African queen) hypothetical protein n=1 Tax=Danaus chrysippus TaxID=151541 RepID=A0A8J2R935_9NEOP|nr:unnamed protein product [Danaus chrysippus]